MPSSMLQRLLPALDVGPAGAALRILLGLSFAVLLPRVAPGLGVAGAALALAALLVGVKVFTAVARRFVGAGPAVRAVWEKRRLLARYHDSYQWRKLTWLGAGILAALATGAEAGWHAPLGWACLGAGLAAEVAWRMLGVAMPTPPASTGGNR